MKSLSESFKKTNLTPQEKQVERHLLLGLDEQLGTAIIEDLKLKRSSSNTLTND